MDFFSKQVDRFKEYSFRQTVRARRGTDSVERLESALKNVSEIKASHIKALFHETCVVTCYPTVGALLKLYDGGYFIVLGDLQGSLWGLTKNAGIVTDHVTYRRIKRVASASEEHDWWATANCDRRIALILHLFLEAR